MCSSLPTSKVMISNKKIIMKVGFPVISPTVDEAQTHISSSLKFWWSTTKILHHHTIKDRWTLLLNYPSAVTQPNYYFHFTNVHSTFTFYTEFLHRKPQPKKITPLLSYTYFFYCSFITFRIRPFIHFKRTKIMNENVVKEMSKLCLKNPTTLFSSSNPKSIRVWWVLCGSISSGNKCLFYMCST